MLGAGSWGTTVAALVAPRSPTVLWARSGDVAHEINADHRNERYLPGVRLPRSLRASDSIEETLRNADVVVMGVPSIGFRAVLEEVKRHLRPWVPIVSLSKGVERPESPRFQLDRVDLSVPIENLGMGLGAIGTRDVPRYPSLMQRAFEGAGWDASRFRGYRCRLQYPVPLVSVTYWFDLPPAP